MYEDENYKVNWIKILLRIVIIFLLLLLTIRLIYMFKNHTKKNTSTENQYVTEENLNILDTYAKKNYSGENAPATIGSSINNNINYILEKGDLEEFNDLKDYCDFDKSYIEAVRLDGEIQYTSYLICGDEEDSKVSYESIEEETETTKSTKSTKTTTAKTTTAKTTTSKKSEETTNNNSSTTNKTTVKTTAKTTSTVKTYTVSYNVNGGTAIKASKVKSGNKVTLPTPTRKGYTFLGWYYHGNKFDANTKITKNYVLVAKWKED